MSLSSRLEDNKEEEEIGILKLIVSSSPRFDLYGPGGVGADSDDARPHVIPRERHLVYGLGLRDWGLGFRV